MKEFIFKFKDINIARVHIDRNKVNIVEIYNTKLDNIINNIDIWIQSRLHYSNRVNVIKLLKRLNIHDVESYVYITNAVSFTDCFWASSGGEKWENINPNRYDLFKGDVIGSLIKTGTFSRISIYSKTPEPQSGGTFDKCWEIIGNKVYLLKGSSEKWSESSGNESYSEVLCNQLEEFMGVQSYIKYSCDERIFNINGESKIFNIAKSMKFTSEKYSYIPIEFIKVDINDNNKLYDYFCSIGSGKLYLQMLMLDALTMNVDRHTENFGIILDDNLDVTGMAPIFDNNLTLTPSLIIKNRTVEQIEKELQTKYPNRHLFDSFFEQGCWVLNKDKSIYDLLDNIYHNFRFERPSGAESISDRRIEFCNYILHRQISGIVNLYKSIK